MEIAREEREGGGRGEREKESAISVNSSEWVPAHFYLSALSLSGPPFPPNFHCDVKGFDHRSLEIVQNIVVVHGF